MEKLISLKLSSYDDKEKLVSALTNSGYIVGAELEKDKVIPSRTYGWRVDIYKKETGITITEEDVNKVVEEIKKEHPDLV